MSEKPVIHGRDHRVGGSDPIPGLNGGGGLGVDWADTGVVSPPVPTSWQQATAPSQNLPAAETALSWTAVNGGLFETVTSPTLLKFKVAGFYIATLRILGFIPAGKVFEAALDIPTGPFSNVTAIAITGGFGGLTMAQVAGLAVGNNVGVQVRHTEASAMSFTATIRFALLNTTHQQV